MRRRLAREIGKLVSYPESNHRMSRTFFPWKLSIIPAGPISGSIPSIRWGTGKAQPHASKEVVLLSFYALQSSLLTLSLPILSYQSMHCWCLPHEQKEPYTGVSSSCVLSRAYIYKKISRLGANLVYRTPLLAHAKKIFAILLPPYSIYEKSIEHLCSLQNSLINRHFCSFSLILVSSMS